MSLREIYSKKMKFKPRKSSEGDLRTRSTFFAYRGTARALRSAYIYIYIGGKIRLYISTVRPSLELRFASSMTRKILESALLYWEGSARKLTHA